MNRKDTTKLLGQILYNQKFVGMGKYFASEVTVNYGTKDECRVDFMQFAPPSPMSVSCLEKGIFICYEIKSCLADFKSGYGQNYMGEKGEIEKMQMVKECCRNCKHYTEGTCMLLPELLSVDDELVKDLKIEIKEPWDFNCNKYE